MSLNKRLLHIDTSYKPVKKKIKSKYPAIERNPRDPVYVYLKSFDSENSKRTATYALHAIARHLGKERSQDIIWARFNRLMLLELIDILSSEKQSDSPNSSLKKGLAPDTVRLYISVIKGVCKEAFLMDMIPAHEWEKIRLTKAPKGSRQAEHTLLDQHRYKRLMHDCSTDSAVKGPRDTAIFALLVGCGLRRAEVVSLDIDDIWFKKRKVRVIGKGNKERLVNMHSSVAQAIRTFIEELRGVAPGPLFTSINKAGHVSEKRLSVSGIYHLCQDRGLLTDTDRIPPHSLRRTYATWVHESGFGLKTIQKQLGHQSVKTTEKYIFVNDEFDEMLETVPF